MRKSFLFLLIPLFVFGQKSIDITGRASLNMEYFDYSDKSAIKPDSISSKEYSKTYHIPGFRQFLNLSIFARTRNLDISLLSDIRNNSWDQFQFDDHKSVDRFTLNFRFKENEIILGDFFESGSEYFVQSRAIRGAKMDFRFNNLWNKNAYINFKSFGGISEKSYSQGSRVRNVYKQFESSGQFRRWLAGTSVTGGDRGSFKLGGHYLFAKDDENSIGESLNEALTNHNVGGEASVSFWKKRVQLFGEGFLSVKDTANFGTGKDYTHKSGVDFRYDQFKLIAYYNRIGTDYYSAGFPFLLNDREGFKVQSAYNVPDILYFGTDFEQYQNNLDDIETSPVTDTRIAEVSATTVFKDVPEFTFLLGFRDDISDVILSGENNEDKSKTDKISRKYEFRVSHSFKVNRISLSTTFLELDDKSKIVSSAPLGTEQHIASLNFYTRFFNDFFVSGGAVYSRLLLTDSKDNRNIFIYQSSRWDAIPQKLSVESSFNVSLNNGINGGNDDLLNDYTQIDGRISIEYFVNSSLSLKLIGGSNLREMQYTKERALQMLSTGEIDDPAFFNGNESYNALIYGAEINWIF